MIVAILTVIASLIITTVGSIVGLILCVIGAVVTLPLSQLIVYYFQGHLYGQLARLAGSDVATGDFATAPPAPPTDEPTMDDALPVELVPPVVYDPEAEPEPTAQTEPPVEPEAPAEEEQPAEEDPPAEDQPPEVPKSQ